MRNILAKEMRLSASILAYCFIVFGLMFLLPGYPILCGVFFTTLGLYQSFQYASEANDIMFSALLPISKRDIVSGRFAFTCLIELCSFALMSICVALRMITWASSAVYRQNVMMNANLFALGAALIIFGLFNVVFLVGFFRTGYNVNKPFLIYIIVAFLFIGIFEALHHFPSLSWVNSFGMDNIQRQITSLAAGIVIYLLMTIVSYRRACVHFEKIDL